MLTLDEPDMVGAREAPPSWVGAFDGALLAPDLDGA